MDKLITNIKKTIRHFKEKGAILTLLKIWDYLSSQYQMRKKGKEFNCKLRNELIVISEDSKNIKIRLKEKNIPPQEGNLITEIKNLEIWHNSRDADWSLIDFNNHQIKLKQYWWNLPLSQHWKVKLKENKIYWNISMEVESQLLLEEIKAMVIIHNHYNLSPSVAEELILECSGEHPRLKLYILKSLFPFVLDVRNENNPDKCLIEISSKEERIYPPARYDLFDIMLEFVTPE